MRTKIVNKIFFSIFLFFLFFFIRFALGHMYGDNAQQENQFFFLSIFVVRTKENVVTTQLNVHLMVQLSTLLCDFHCDTKFIRFSKFRKFGISFRFAVYVCVCLIWTRRMRIIRIKIHLNDTVCSLRRFENMCYVLQNEWTVLFRVWLLH